MKLLLVSLISILMIPVYANDIYVTQTGTGNNLTLDIDQNGINNTVNMSIGAHTGNTVKVQQDTDGSYVGYTTAWGSRLSSGGDLDGQDNSLDIRQYCNTATCASDRFEFRIVGDGNSVTFGQGYEFTSRTSGWNTDTYEQGGHFTRLDIDGSRNTYKGSQRSHNWQSDHTKYITVNGDDNDIFTRQRGNEDKTITLTVNNDDNEVTLTQRDNAEHNATITLDGSYPTDITLLQKTSSAKTYSLTQNCQTSGGCTISVTQD